MMVYQVFGVYYFKSCQLSVLKAIIDKIHYNIDLVSHYSYLLSIGVSGLE
ncbi:hypothetical protein VCRA2133E348_400007 [Vibrio crassostreae]|nr:hypothetical protein VCRA2133E348_400007 [Vibrio crassostreae]